MTDPTVETKFYLNKIIGMIDDANLEAVKQIALAIEGETKFNIRDNGQIDTGFMVNSVFAITPESSGYGAAKAAAEAKNPKAEMAPEPTLDSGALAGVAVGAEYAINQEAKKPFLYPAAQKVAEKAGMIVKKVFDVMVKDENGNFAPTGEQVTE